MNAFNADLPNVIGRDLFRSRERPNCKSSIDITIETAVDAIVDR